MIQPFTSESEIIIGNIIGHLECLNSEIESNNKLHQKKNSINNKKIDEITITSEDREFLSQYEELSEQMSDLDNVEIKKYFGFLFGKNMQDSQNLAIYFTKKISKIEIYLSDATFYSSYTTKQIDFANKNLCWFTNKLDQSILFPFDTSKVTYSNIETFEPHVYSFKIKTNLRLINSSSLDNAQIFDNFFDFGKKYFEYIIFDVFGEKLNEFTFSIQNNKKILYFIEAINRFVKSNVTRGNFKIHGYKNDLDQSEIAVINFTNIVKKDSIKEYKINEIRKGKFFHNFPVVDKFNFFNMIKGIMYQQKHSNIEYYSISKSRMTCPKALLIKYSNTNGQEPEQVFNCDCMPIDVWQQKYLKYKNKYLKLKAQFNM